MALEPVLSALTLEKACSGVRLILETVADNGIGQSLQPGRLTAQPRKALAQVEECERLRRHAMHVPHVMQAIVQIQHAVPDIPSGPGDVSPLGDLAWTTGQEPIGDAAMVGEGRGHAVDQGSCSGLTT